MSQSGVSIGPYHTQYGQVCFCFFYASGEHFRPWEPQRWIKVDDVEIFVASTSTIVAVTMSQHWMLGCLQETSWFQGIFFSGSFPKKPLFWPSNHHTKATISIQIFLCGINPPYIIPIRFPLDYHFESFNIPIISHLIT